MTNTHLNTSHKEVNIITKTNEDKDKFFKNLSHSWIMKELIYQIKHAVYKNNNEIKKEIILPVFKYLSDIFLPYIIFIFTLIFLNLLITLFILYILLRRRI